MMKYTALVGTATADQVKRLVVLSQGEDEQGWKALIEATGIGYSRGWLLARTAYLERTAPELITPMSEMLTEAQKDGAKSEEWVKWFAHRIVVPMRDDAQLSWGEISVRLQIPESRVRKFYKGDSDKKDLGLRIGKGGRWAYDDPTLYLDNRVKEGAYIPKTVVGRPKVEELMNYKAPEAPKVRKPRTRKGKVSA